MTGTSIALLITTLALLAVGRGMGVGEGFRMKEESKLKSSKTNVDEK